MILQFEAIERVLGGWVLLSITVGGKSQQMIFIFPVTMQHKFGLIDPLI